jgi:flagellar biosynthesis protein FliP
MRQQGRPAAPTTPLVAKTVSRTSGRARRLGTALGLALLAVLAAGCSGGQEGLPSVQVQMGSGQGDQATMGVQLLLLLTVLSLVPAVLMMVTSFVRIAIVLSFARSAIGVAQMPPNQILLGLALFLTVFVMAPVWTTINDAAVQPYLRNEVSLDEAYARAEQPLRNFMLRQTREKDLALFVNLGNLPQPDTEADVPTYALVPSFMISELKTSFQMGFIILLPFLVIDMVVSSTLMAMGMMMLPPATISLPFKVLLFVMADGWHLIVKSLVSSFMEAE